MNLAGSVHTTAYLSVEDCVRPKLEIGSSANGVFELNFTVNNFGDTSSPIISAQPYLPRPLILEALAAKPSTTSTARLMC